MAPPENHEHGPSHDHAPLGEAPRRALWVAIILNACFMLVEFVVGWWANSLALLSDAGHMVSDVASLVLALVAVNLADTQVGDSYTFGLQRVPVLGALVNGATLIIVVVLIVRAAVARLVAPPEVAGYPVLIAGGLGLVVNVVSAWYLHLRGGSSVNIRGALLHLIADALGSVAAIASAVVILWTGWWLIDPLLSVVIGALIVYSAWPLLRETVGVILQRAPEEVDVDELRTTILAHRSVDSIVDLHLWQLDTRHRVMTAILQTDTDMTLAECNQIGDEVKGRLCDRFGIVHATIEWRDADHPVQGCVGEAYDLEIFPHHRDDGE